MSSKDELVKEPAHRSVRQFNETGPKSEGEVEDMGAEEGTESPPNSTK